MFLPLLVRWKAIVLLDDLEINMVTLENLEQWLLAPAETEQLEFKEAKQQYDTTKLLRYCVALANEGGVI